MGAIGPCTEVTSDAAATCGDAYKVTDPTEKNVSKKLTLVTEMTAVTMCAFEIKTILVYRDTTY